MSNFSVLNSEPFTIECPYCNIASACRVKFKESDSADVRPYDAKCLQCAGEFSDFMPVATTAAMKKR
jgi:hypothetical protein